MAGIYHWICCCASDPVYTKIMFSWDDLPCDCDTSTYRYNDGYTTFRKWDTATSTAVDMAGELSVSSSTATATCTPANANYPLGHTLIVNTDFELWYQFYSSSASGPDHTHELYVNGVLIDSMDSPPFTSTTKSGHTSLTAGDTLRIRWWPHGPSDPSNAVYNDEYWDCGTGGYMAPMKLWTYE